MSIKYILYITALTLPFLLTFVTLIVIFMRTKESSFILVDFVYGVDSNSRFLITVNLKQLNWLSWSRPELVGYLSTRPYQVKNLNK